MLIEGGERFCAATTMESMTPVLHGTSTFAGCSREPLALLLLRTFVGCAPPAPGHCSGSSRISASLAEGHMITISTRAQPRPQSARAPALSFLSLELPVPHAVCESPTVNINVVGSSVRSMDVRFLGIVDGAVPRKSIHGAPSTRIEKERVVIGDMTHPSRYEQQVRSIVRGSRRLSSKLYCPLGGSMVFLSKLDCWLGLRRGILSKLYCRF
jgi:hypothetical protein